MVKKTQTIAAFEVTEVNVIYGAYFKERYQGFFRLIDIFKLSNFQASNQIIFLAMWRRALIKDYTISRSPCFFDLLTVVPTFATLFSLDFLK